MKIEPYCQVLIGLLLLAVISVSQSAEDQSAKSKEKVTLNFVNADIGSVIQTISKISGKNFVLGPRVKGVLNIVTSNPVSPELTYSILLSALRLQGYTAVESQGVTKIVLEADAKVHAAPLGKNVSVGSKDELITQVFNIKNESATQLLSVVRPLISPNNTVTVYQGNNSLVVTDYAANVARVAQIISAIDVPQGDIRIIPLKHASAHDLAQTITRLVNEAQSGSSLTGVGSTGDLSQKVTIVGEPRTNSLLVKTDNLSKLSAIRQLVRNLDQPGAAGNIHVIFMKNAEAIKVAQTLRNLTSSEMDSNLNAGFTNANNNFSPTSNSIASPVNSSGASNIGSGLSAIGNSGNASMGASSISAGSYIQADPMTNSLIITAPDPIYNNLRNVIEKLDRRRAQVYVEALITEVSTEKAAEIGIQWQAGKTNGSTSLIGGTNFNSNGNNILSLAAGLASGTAAATPGNGLNLILGGGSISIGGRELSNLNLLARFLESDSKANILSTPNLVTLDNEEAKIVVGRNVPFVTGSYATAGGAATATPFTTVERKDVGLTLKVKPQISEGGTVRLQIYQEASAIIDTTSSAINGPSTTKRSIESTVLVDDGSVIALGGLVEDTYSGGIQKVPLIGDLPYIGSLFRYNTRSRGKTNLIVFLRPVILRDKASIQELSDERYDYMTGLQKSSRLQDGLVSEEQRPPTLPSLDSPAPYLSNPDSSNKSNDDSNWESR